MDFDEDYRFFLLQGNYNDVEESLMDALLEHLNQDEKKLVLLFDLEGNILENIR